MSNMTVQVTVVKGIKRSDTIYIDPATTTGEDFLVLAEVALEESIEGLVGIIELPNGQGPPLSIHLDMSKLLRDQGITTDGAVVRLQAEGSTVIPQSPPIVPNISSSQHHANSPPTDSSIQNLLQLFQSGASGGVVENGSLVSAASQHRHQQPLLPDPMDPDYQAKLYERIQQENMMTNLEQAIEHTPEAFARVVMLYVKATVNKYPITAFVDSGAQMTIMNEQTAEKCGILRLLDRRMRGIAKGVGTGKILGRIHMTMVNIGGVVMPMSITILESQDMEFIIGLDQMKRHQMIIDLKKNALRLAEDVEVPFLTESDIPNMKGEDEEHDANVIEESQKSTGVSNSVSSATTTIPKNNTSFKNDDDDNDTGTCDTANISAQQVSVTTNTKESIIAQVMLTAGVDRVTAVGALQASEWNVDLAVGLLFD
eukprot:Tbor_TRINITY_DN4897_c0_g1::TRINITY_DN4897_c0_g1_i1::g.1291::m.1291/K11885/DDI1; DNA damage-inducible protein 1